MTKTKHQSITQENQIRLWIDFVSMHNGFTLNIRRKVGAKMGASIQKWGPKQEGLQ